MKNVWRIAAVVAAFGAGFVVRGIVPEPVAQAQAGRVFELRTYTAPEGKLEALHARFKNHTVRIFNKHHMTSIGYFRPVDAPLKDNTLIYVLAHPSRQEAAKNWAEFRADPEWQKVSAESEANGRIVAKVESVFLEPADYSPLK
jgi:NIPSNAP